GHGSISHRGLRSHCARAVGSRLNRVTRSVEARRAQRAPRQTTSEAARLSTRVHAPVLVDLDLVGRNPDRFSIAPYDDRLTQALLAQDGLAHAGAEDPLDALTVVKDRLEVEPPSRSLRPSRG